MKSDTIFEKHSTHTLEIQKKSSKNSRPQKNVIDNDAASLVSVDESGMTRAEKSIPFVLENAHHASIKSRGIARSERHDNEGILLAVGSEESQLFLIG